MHKNLEITRCHCRIDIGFYRAMHYSAKRGLAIACRLSVRPSVCPSVTLMDHDHIGWKSWKLIVRAISPTSSPLAAQRSCTYSQRNMEKFRGDEVGLALVHSFSTASATPLCLHRWIVLLMLDHTDISIAQQNASRSNLCNRTAFLLDMLADRQTDRQTHC